MSLHITGIQLQYTLNILIRKKNMIHCPDIYEFRMLCKYLKQYIQHKGISNFYML